eukprot:363047-Chlamydomonas_euryale.AAC.10
MGGPVLVPRGGHVCRWTTLMDEELGPPNSSVRCLQPRQLGLRACVCVDIPPEFVWKRVRR